MSLFIYYDLKFNLLFNIKIIFNILKIIITWSNKNIKKSRRH